MLLRKIAFAALGAGLLVATAACQPIVSYAGFQAIEEDPKDIKVGTDTKSTVRARLTRVITRPSIGSVPIWRSTLPGSRLEPVRPWIIASTFSSVKSSPYGWTASISMEPTLISKLACWAAMLAGVVRNRTNHSWLCSVKT